MLSEQPVLGKYEMIATAHYLATQAGLHILTHGGNAIDAAIAAATTIAVVYLFTCSTDEDVFMLTWEAKTQRLYGLDGSGPAPQGLTYEWITGGWHRTCTNHSYQSRYSYF
jgi:gamma-glutamyltranspeptidase/glutathione hydrolase